MDKNIVFATNGAERMRITATGNVGIGTTAPTSKVTIFGSTAMGAGGVPENTSTELMTTWLRPGTANVQVGASFGITLGAKSAMIDSPGKVYFQVNNTASAANNWGNTPDKVAMTLTGDGNVGIGTNNPQANLHVYSEAVNTVIQCGKATTENNVYRDSIIIRPHAYINATGNYNATTNQSGTMFLHGSHLFHGTWNAFNQGGTINITAGSCFSEGNNGSATNGHELGGDVFICSGGVARRKDGGNGPYTRGGDVHIRTGDVKTLNNQASVWPSSMDYTTRLFVSGENGNVGINTTASYSPLVVKTAMSIDPLTFTIGGDLDKFYPVLFTPVGHVPNHPTIQLSRYIHDDSNARGSMTLELSWKSWAWGDGATYYAYKFSYSENRKFISKFQYEWYGGGFVVYLRGGGTSYSFRGMNAALSIANPTGIALSGANGEVFPIQLSIEPALDVWYGEGDTRRNLFCKGGQVGIGTGNPSHRLHVNGTVGASMFTSLFQDVYCPSLQNTFTMNIPYPGAYLFSVISTGVSINNSTDGDEYAKATIYIHLTPNGTMITTVVKSVGVYINSYTYSTQTLSYNIGTGAGLQTVMGGGNANVSIMRIA